MNPKKSGRLHGKTEKILRDMLEMFRRNENGVKVDDFIDYLQKHKTSRSDAENWDPKGRGKERTVYRYIGQLKALGCKIAYNVDNGNYVLLDRDWQLPEKTPWSLSSNAIQKVGEKLLPMLKDLILPQDILKRIDEGLRICIKDKDTDAEKAKIRKTVVSAWAERRVLTIKYDRGYGEKHSIEPHGLVLRNSEWQLVAKDGNKTKTFSLSKITEAYLSEEPFDFNSEVLDKALGENRQNEEEANQTDSHQANDEHLS